jgi:hypothetical protein
MSKPEIKTEAVLVFRNKRGELLCATTTTQKVAERLAGATKGMPWDELKKQGFTCKPGLLAQEEEVGDEI